MPTKNQVYNLFDLAIQLRNPDLEFWTSVRRFFRILCDSPAANSTDRSVPTLVQRIHQGNFDYGERWIKYFWLSLPEDERCEWVCFLRFWMRTFKAVENVAMEVIKANLTEAIRTEQFEDSKAKREQQDEEVKSP